MHPNTRVGSSRGEQMGLGNFQLFRVSYLLTMGRTEYAPAHVHSQSAWPHILVGCGDRGQCSVLPPRDVIELLA